MQRQEKGITLVALIITVVVLLILAIVTINSVNENGIIEYAKNATNEYVKSRENETSIFSEYFNYIEDNRPKQPITIIVGDINGDGYVNATDTRLLGNYIDGNQAIERSEYFPELGDVNEDGEVNETDINYIRTWISGSRPTEAQRIGKEIIIYR